MVLKMDFEDKVGVSGGQSQKEFQGKPKARAKALRHAELVCGGPLCALVCHYLSQGGQLQWQRELER